MAQIPFILGTKIFGYDGIEFTFSADTWLWWPKTSNDNGLLFLRNSMFQCFFNTSWHSARFYP